MPVSSGPSSTIRCSTAKPSAWTAQSGWPRARRRPAATQPSPGNRLAPGGTIARPSEAVQFDAVSLDSSQCPRASKAGSLSRRATTCMPNGSGTAAPGTWMKPAGSDRVGKPTNENWRTLLGCCGCVCFLSQGLLTYSHWRLCSDRLAPPVAIQVEEARLGIVE